MKNVSESSQKGIFILIFYILFFHFFSFLHPIYSQPPDILWEKTYGGWSFDIGYGVQQTSDGGYIIVGFTSSFGAGYDDVYLIKTDSKGDTVWTRTYGGSNWDRGFSVKQTSDGGYIIVGTTTSFGAGLYDVYLIKTDSKGDTVWTRTYGGENSDAGYWIEKTSNGGYIVTGDTRIEGTHDAYLIKIDADGDTIWTGIYGKPDNVHRSEVGYCVLQTVDGGYIVTGETLESHPLLYLIKTDSNGDTLWTRSYPPGFITGAGYFVRQTSDGGYIITGETERIVWPREYPDLLVMKIQNNGDTLWRMNLGGSGIDVGRCVQQTSDGGYIIVGYTNSFGAGYDDVYLIKTTPDVGVKERNLSAQRADFYLVGIFPNIVRDRAIVKLSSPSGGDFRLILYDISGRTIMERRLKAREPGIQGIELSMGIFKRGIYFVRVERNRKIGGCIPILYIGQ